MAESTGEDEIPDQEKRIERARLLMREALALLDQTDQRLAGVKLETAICAISEDRFNRR